MFRPGTADRRQSSPPLSRNACLNSTVMRKAFRISKLTSGLVEDSASVAVSALCVGKEHFEHIRLIWPCVGLDCPVSRIDRRRNCREVKYLRRAAKHFCYDGECVVVLSRRISSKNSPLRAVVQSITRRCCDIEGLRRDVGGVLKLYHIDPRRLGVPHGIVVAIHCLLDAGAISCYAGRATAVGAGSRYPCACFETVESSCTRGDA
jgi:hypothetical protein